MNQTTSKSELRKALRRIRREHAIGQPEEISALLFHRPPAPLLSKIGEEAVIALYHAVQHEAPARGYARFFQTEGHRLTLPYFDGEATTMTFREYTDPHDDTDLECGPFGISQPMSRAPELLPEVLFVPLVGFSEELRRLGQGGGHYDRWLSEHPGRLAIGLAWDVQLVENLPIEPHDITLDAVVTPTRLYGLN